MVKETKKLLEVRKTIKARKPDFIQQDYHKKARLVRKWKRPTGLQSKMRHQFKGYSRRVKQGWRSPSEIRGFHGSGIQTVIVHTVKQLDTVPKTYGIIIASSVGIKKRLAIIEKAEQLKIIIVNIKPEKFKQKVAAMKAKTLEDKKQKDDKKKRTLEESLKKAEKDKKDKEKAKQQENVSDVESEEQKQEEKKEEEKKIKDDVLIHKA